MAKKAPAKEITVEDKLRALYALQKIDSKIDKIQTVRGELPLEVQDLEDEIVGLETRINKFSDELKDLTDGIAAKKNLMTEAKVSIKKYEKQQMNVRNNREFDAISKEIEYQNLEIQLAEKRIKEANVNIITKTETIDSSQGDLDERKKDLDHKKSELDEITAETEKEEATLKKSSVKAAKIVEERLVSAYHRVRDNARNGLAVVAVDRDSCGGCFNKIPPQRQMDIKSHKKIIVCEHCGRILVDVAIDEKTTEKA